MVYTSHPNQLAMAFGCYGVSSCNPPEAGPELYLVNCSETSNEYTVETVDFALSICKRINGVWQPACYTTSKNNVLISMVGIYGYADGQSTDIYANAYDPESEYPFAVSAIAIIKGRKVSDNTPYTKQMSCVPGTVTQCDSGDTVAPAHLSTISAGFNDFIWQDGRWANQYRLIIRRMGDKVIVYDVTTYNLCMAVSLPAGSYQWKIDWLDSDCRFSSWTGDLWNDFTVV